MKNHDYVFRLADKKDAETIFSFLKQLAEYENRLIHLKLTLEKLTQVLSKESQLLKSLICEYNGESIGMVLWGERFSPYAGGINLFLIDLYVKPSHRKNGLGRRFISELKMIAQKNSYIRIEWFVDKDNFEAKQFYTKIGGKHLEQSEHWKLDL